MVALRKKGMKDRHWDEISAKAGREVRPKDDFTFTKLLDMGMMEHINMCVDVG